MPCLLSETTRKETISELSREDNEAEQGGNQEGVKEE